MVPEESLWSWPESQLSALPFLLKPNSAERSAPAAVDRFFLVLEAGQRYFRHPVEETFHKYFFLVHMNMMQFVVWNEDLILIQFEFIGQFNLP